MPLTRSSLKHLPFHPLLFALYPPLYLLALNVDQVYLWVAVRPLLAALAGAALLWGALTLILRSAQRAAVLATFLLVAFFAYGHLLRLLGGLSIGGLDLGRNRYLALPYLLLAAYGTWRILRAKTDFLRIGRVLNIAGAALLLFSLGQIGWYELRANTAQGSPNAPDVSASVVAGTQPDVYVLVLDGYARADQMLADLGYDNTPFLDDLRARGFAVADCSRSNYNFTDMSLASTFNLDYLPGLGVARYDADAEKVTLPGLIRQNAVRAIFKELGYRLYAFETTYVFSDWWGVDEFMSAEDSNALLGSLNPFESLLIHSTYLDVLFEAQSALTHRVDQAVNRPYTQHVRQVHFTLDKLATLPAVPGPKFVFAHILVPHEPLIFKPDGSLQSEAGFFGGEGGDPANFDYFRRGYTDQVQFINARALTIVDRLIAQSAQPPIIVLMSDHGYYWGTTYPANLQALYLPPGRTGLQPLPQSNVNIFRFLLSEYFGADYPALPDASYINNADRSGFEEVPESLPGCAR